MNFLKAFVESNFVRYPIQISPILKGTWTIRSNNKRTVIIIEEEDEKKHHQSNNKVLHTYSGSCFGMKH